MKPKPSSATTQPDFFQTELKSIINLSHPLVKLAEEFNWDEFEQQLQPTYAPVMGAPGINTRLVVALHFLKHRSGIRAIEPPVRIGDLGVIPPSSVKRRTSSQ
jgi:IS5 family transposase